MDCGLEIKNMSFFRISSRTGQNPFKLKKSKRVMIFQDLSLTITQGERVALLGQNGAGKTTLLRIMAGIFQPDCGSVIRNGQISTFLDGTYGLDPFLTGRENSRSRMIMSKVGKDDVEKHLNNIEEFADLGEYFDQPVKNYSTGMILRLIFSIGTVKTNQILLIDEGFGTADIEFQNKAFARLNSIYDKSPIIVMASHNLELLRSQCLRGVVIVRGKIVFDGAIGPAIDYYLEN